MIKYVTVHEAKTTLSKLLVDVEHGGDVVISRRRTPVARLVPYERLARAPWGSLRLDGPVDDAAFAPMDTDELTAWGLVEESAGST